MNATNEPSDDQLRVERASLDAEYVRLTNDLATRASGASDQFQQQRVHAITTRMTAIDIELVRRWHDTRQAPDEPQQCDLVLDERQHVRDIDPATDTDPWLPTIDESYPDSDQAEDGNTGLDRGDARRRRNVFADGMPFFEIVSLMAWIGVIVMVLLWLSSFLGWT